MKQALSLTLKIEKTLTIKESDTTPGTTEYLVDGERVFTVDTKELEILTAFQDKVLG